MTSSGALERLLELIKRIRGARSEPPADFSVRRERVHDTLLRLRSAYKLKSAEDDASD
jgi:hypothetical protein